MVGEKKRGKVKEVDSFFFLSAAPTEDGALELILLAGSISRAQQLATQGREHGTDSKTAHAARGITPSIL